MTDLHVCETCEVLHYDNCPTCFGFGVKRVFVPVSSLEAYCQRIAEIKADNPIFRPCPVCGSTVYGVSKDPIGYAFGEPCYSDEDIRRVLHDHGVNYDEFKNGEIIPLYRIEKP